MNEDKTVVQKNHDLWESLPDSPREKGLLLSALESFTASRQAEREYVELPKNDLVWWGMSIISLSVITETFIVSVMMADCLRIIAGAFRQWVSAGAPGF